MIRGACFHHLFIFGNEAGNIWKMMEHMENMQVALKEAVREEEEERASARARAGNTYKEGVANLVKELRSLKKQFKNFKYQSAHNQQPRGSWARPNASWEAHNQQPRGSRARTSAS